MSPVSTWILVCLEGWHAGNNLTLHSTSFPSRFVLQMLTDDNVFTFLEVSQGSDGVTQLCKLHPSVRVTPGELPKILPMPHPEPCMMNLNPPCWEKLRTATEFVLLCALVAMCCWLTNFQTPVPLIMCSWKFASTCYVYCVKLYWTTVWACRHFFCYFLYNCNLCEFELVFCYIVYLSAWNSC